MPPTISHVEEPAVPAGSPGAGTVAAAERQVLRGKRRGLSKGVKIAIVLGVGVAVLAAIIGYKASHPLDGINFGEL